MTIQPDLLEILVCPQDRGPLRYVDEGFLYNERLRRAYPIRDGVPILLIDEARDVDDAEHQQIVQR